MRTVGTAETQDKNVEVVTKVGKVTLIKINSFQSKNNINAALEIKMVIKYAFQCCKRFGKYISELPGALIMLCNDVNAKSSNFNKM